MTAAVSKKMQAWMRFSDQLQSLSCPICGDDFVTKDGGFGCRNNHSFDLARQGYLNLFMGAQKSLYDKELFMARQEVFSAGIYDPLITQVAATIQKLDNKTPFVLDAGCGEGSFLAKLYGHLGQGSFMGIDISRDGIKLAVSHEEPIMWCVADLARLPLNPGKVDVVLNILSPANYGEFQRVLRPNGRVIKVLPSEDYLREIRLRLQGAVPYSNEEVLANLEEHMDIQGRTSVHYKVPVTPGLWRAMVAMTPLTQHRILSGDPPESLTLDLQILEGFVSNV